MVKQKIKNFCYSVLIILLFIYFLFYINLSTTQIITLIFPANFSVQSLTESLPKVFINNNGINNGAERISTNSSSSVSEEWMEEGFDPYDNKTALDDPRLLNYIRHRMKPPPPRGTLEYNLATKKDNPSDHRGELKRLTDKYTSSIKNGIFVDCGANDGEWFSNTLYLERFKNWTGVLLEPNKLRNKLLYKTNRVAWLGKFCLSKTAEKMEFLHRVGDPYGGMDKLAPAKGYKETVNFRRKDYSSLGIVECFPLYSILLAVNITQVDFFSLDVEGFEYKVLSSIPFDKIKFKIILTEHKWAPEKKEKIKELLEANDFKLIVTDSNDLLFIHKSLAISIYQGDMLAHQNPYIWFNL